MNLLKTILSYGCISLPLLLSNTVYAEQHHHDHHHEYEHAQVAAHQHGIATMQLAIVKNSVLIEVQSPLFNVFGFEHQANNDQQKAIVNQQLAAINKAQLVVLSANAKCQLNSKHIQHLFQGQDAHNRHHGHDHHASEQQHRDLSFEYQYECQKPEYLMQIDMAPLFKAWPNLEYLQVEWLSADQQSATKLTSTQTVLTLQ